MNNNILDSRNLQERLEELQSDFDTWKDSLTPEQISEIKDEYTSEGEEISDEDFGWAWETEIGSDATELKNLIELKDEFDSSTWNDGITFVKDSYFEEFAEDEADQLGLVENTNQWPYTCIDWKKAARELQMEYSSVDYDGETYYHRS